MREQFLDDACGVTNPRRFHQDPRRWVALGREQFLQGAAEICLSRAAQATARHQPHIVGTLRRSGDRQRVDAGIGEFIEQHDPPLIGRLVGH